MLRIIPESRFLKWNLSGLRGSPPFRVDLLMTPFVVLELKTWIDKA